MVKLELMNVWILGWTRGEGSSRRREEQKGMGVREGKKGGGKGKGFWLTYLTKTRTFSWGNMRDFLKYLH